MFWFDDEFWHEHIPMTIWNNHIVSVGPSHVYSIRDVKVNSFNGKYVNTQHVRTKKTTNIVKCKKGRKLRLS